MLIKFLLRLPLLISSIQSPYIKEAPPSNKGDIEKQEYHIYLDIIENKMLALNICIPERFHHGVHAQESSAIGTIFFSKNDPPLNWPKMMEVVTYRQYVNTDLFTTVYESCLSTREAQTEDSLIDHYVLFSRDQGILTATAFFDRPSVSYKYEGGSVIQSKNNELIFFKAIKGFNQVFTVQYIKKYDPLISTEKKKMMIESAKDLMAEITTISDFKGINKKPDENIKTVSITPDEFLEEVDAKIIIKRRNKIVALYPPST